MVRIPSGGGAATPIMDLAKGEFTFAAPQVLPGSKAVLFFVYAAQPQLDKASIEVLTLSDHRRKVVAPGGVSARYLATSSKSGYLLYANGNTLFAVPFDLDHLEKRGTAVTVLDDVAYNPATYESQFDVSRSGTMVYRKTTGRVDGTMTIQWVDSTGKRTPLASRPGAYLYPRLSPDGRRLAATVLGGANQDIQVYDMQRETWTNLTSGATRIFFNPTWTPDGRFVVFGAFAGLFWARSDGASQAKQLIEKQNVLVPWSVAPDGKRLAFVDRVSSASGQIWTASLEDSGGQLKAGTAEPFLKSNFAEGAPAFSPDGKWLAYQSNSSGTNEIYVRGFPDNGGQWKISNRGGIAPIWSRGGHDLLYQSADQEMAVSYSASGNTFIPEKSRVWLAKVGGQALDLSPDGKRLVVLAPSGSADAPKTEHEVVILQNFLDYLRSKVPSK
jgi:serine/threonine-protein kinase